MNLWPSATRCRSRLRRRLPSWSSCTRDFDKENLIPLWTEIGDLMPMVPTPKAVPHVWRWSDLYPLAARAGDLVPVGRGGERRAIALANPGLAGTPYATPDAVGSDPVPRRARNRARAPPLAERLPLRRRGRRGLDRGERGPGGDAPRGLPADSGLELPRPPQRHGPADGLDRRPGHPVRALRRRRVLRVRHRTRHRRGHPGHLPLRTALGPPGPAPAVRAARTPPTPPSPRTAGNTPTPPCANSCSWRTRATRPPSPRATPPSATRTPPPAGT